MAEGGGSKGTGRGSPSARQLVQEGKKIPSGTILQTEDGTLFQVERANGFAISGRTVNNRNYSIDLRQKEATIVGKSTPDDWLYKGQLTL